MTLLFDTSFVATILLRDASWDRAQAWLNDQVDEPAFSDFGRGELVSTLGARVRAGAIRRAAAAQLLDLFAEDAARWSWFDTNAADVARATDFVQRFDLPLRLPDAIHLAIAERTGARLITVDEQQYRAALAHAIPAFNPLSRRSDD